MPVRPYQRLEPRSRSDDPHEGLLARVADPLWMLGRQWQFAEWAANDRGTPVTARIVTKTDPLTEIRLGADPWRPIGTEAIEKQVECEAPLLTWRDRVRAGQLFERMLRDAFLSRAEAWISILRTSDGVAAATASEIVATDEATRSFRRLYAGRAIDGKSLYERLTSTAPSGSVRLPASLTVAAADRAPVESLCKIWIERSGIASFASLPRNAAAWKTDELASAFGLRTQSGSEFSATHYTSGSLDWHTLELTDDRDDGVAADAQPRVFEPTRVAFAGMPELRLFDIEDRGMSFDALSVDKVDWIKLALRKFAFDYRNDWWHVPLEVPAASFTRIRKLVVTDTFGVEYTVLPALASGGSPLERWSAFAASGPDGRPVEGLLLVGALAHREDSEPIEEVAFIFDELENRIWAEERVLQNGIGNAVSGALYHLERVRSRSEHDTSLDRLALVRAVEEARRALDEATALLNAPGVSASAANTRLAAATASLSKALDALLANPVTSSEASADVLPKWQLARAVPAERIPYVVRRIAGTEQIAFRRAQAELTTGERGAALSRAVSAPSGSKWIREDAVPTMGLRIARTVAMARGHGGELLTWIGVRRDL